MTANNSNDRGNLLPTPSDADVARLRSLYAAFNARNIDAALAQMTTDVTWPRAFKGGVVRGPDAVRAYWTEQWGEVDPYVEPVAFVAEDSGAVVVRVHQVVRDLTGALLGDDWVGHRFFFQADRVCAMEVCSPPEAGSNRVG